MAQEVTFPDGQRVLVTDISEKTKNASPLSRFIATLLFIASIVMLVYGLDTKGYLEAWGVNLPRGSDAAVVVPPVEQPDVLEQPVVVDPPTSPDWPETEQVIQENLTPQEHEPFYNWEVPALDPADPASWPAMTVEQQQVFYEQNPDWAARVAAAEVQSEPAILGVEQAPAPAAAQGPGLIVYPTAVPRSQRGPIVAGQRWGPPPSQQQAPQPVPNSPLNPSYTAPQVIQPAPAPGALLEAIPEPEPVAVPRSPTYNVDSSPIQTVDETRCLLGFGSDCD